MKQLEDKGTVSLISFVWNNQEAHYSFKKSEKQQTQALMVKKARIVFTSTQNVMHHELTMTMPIDYDINIYFNKRVSLVERFGF